MWSAMTLSDGLSRSVVCVSRAAARDQRDEEVDLVIRMHVLQHGGEALEAHAGVDARLGQRRHREAVGALLPVELHEHEVPDLDVAVAFGVGRARRPAEHVRTVVVEDLRAGTARARVGHLPEVVARVLARPCCRRCACSAPSGCRCPSSRCRTLRRRRCRRSPTAGRPAARSASSAAPTRSGSRRA